VWSLVLKPSSDSLINMEMWLPPADKWNGKFMASATAASPDRFRV
jgi:hypothetical protein